MNCKRAQAQIALSVGGDLDDTAERELQGHLESCSCCKRHSEQMNRTWTLLSERDDEPADPHDSVWPDLQVRLPNRRELLSRARFNGGVVALCVAAVMLAMVSIWRTANTTEPLLGDPAGLADTYQLAPEGPALPFRQPRQPATGFVPVGESYWSFPVRREPARRPSPEGTSGQPAPTPPPPADNRSF
jgi:predicted anti-sigma-YlaC factor YlaD